MAVEKEETPRGRVLKNQRFELTLSLFEGIGWPVIEIAGIILRQESIRESEMTGLCEKVSQLNGVTKGRKVFDVYQRMNRLWSCAKQGTEYFGRFRGCPNKDAEKLQKYK